MGSEADHRGERTARAESLRRCGRYGAGIFQIKLWGRGRSNVGEKKLKKGLRSSKGV
jgi:hypothetical protein